MYDLLSGAAVQRQAADAVCDLGGEEARPGVRHLVSGDHAQRDQPLDGAVQAGDVAAALGKPDEGSRGEGAFGVYREKPGGGRFFNDNPYTAAVDAVCRSAKNALSYLTEQELRKYRGGSPRKSMAGCCGRRARKSARFETWGAG